MIRRAVLTTGGTGGHIFPALSVAEELRRRNAQAEILFIGGAYGPERDLARKAGLSFVALPVRGVLGRGLKAVAAAALLARGVVLARGLLRDFRPQVVAGFGGYAGACPVLAARTLGIPALVHEQNSVPGAANRLLAKFATTVCVTYPDESGAFPAAKVVRTGNPVRGAILSLREAARPERTGSGLRLLVVGGSQGARAVNSAVASAWPALRDLGVELWHQTGALDFTRMQDAYAAQGGEGVRAAPFIEDMAEAYAWADLVVARAGATTLAELTVAGVPSLLVPFPYATHDHQTVNARWLAARGGAAVLPEPELSPERLVREISELAQTPGRLAAMAAAARGEGRPNAAEAVADELQRVALAA